LKDAGTEEIHRLKEARLFCSVSASEGDGGVSLEARECTMTELRTAPCPVFLVKLGEDKLALNRTGYTNTGGYI
jgi:hypothetical protein